MGVGSVPVVERVNYSDAPFTDFSQRTSRSAITIDRPHPRLLNVTGKNGNSYQPFSALFFCADVDIASKLVLVSLHRTVRWNARNLDRGLGMADRDPLLQ